MNDAFTPKGATAEWRMVYDHIKTLDVGAVLTFDNLDEILGRDFRENRTPIYRAAQQLEKDDHRTLAPVRGVGYRIAEPRDHEALAQNHHRRSRRQMRKAVSKAASADRSRLTPEERKRIDALEMSLRAQADMIRRLEVRDEQRQAEIKQLRRDTSADVAEISARVDRLAELLERHGVALSLPDTAA